MKEQTCATEPAPVAQPWLRRYWSVCVILPVGALYAAICVVQFHRSSFSGRIFATLAAYYLTTCCFTVAYFGYLSRRLERIEARLSALKRGEEA